MENCEKVFSKYVLTDDKLRKFMKRKDFEKFMELKHSLKDLNFELADIVAKAIKKWALSLGATHYTHWFFPLTGIVGKSKGQRIFCEFLCKIMH